MTRRQSLARSLALLATLAPPLRAQDSALVPRHFVTRWADSVTPARVLPGYPRPQLRRRAWINLNGLWDYAIRDSGVSRPRAFDGKILVPFPVESQLSGVRRAVTDSERLWYHRTVTLPREPRGTRWLLHFGAVDWDATVYVNGRRVGEHRGGYDPFSFDITSEVIGGPLQRCSQRPRIADVSGVAAGGHPGRGQVGGEGVNPILLAGEERDGEPFGAEPAGDGRAKP